MTGTVGSSRRFPTASRHNQPRPHQTSQPSHAKQIRLGTSTAAP